VKVQEGVDEENLQAIPLDLPKLTLILAFLHFKGDFGDGIACFITLNPIIHKN